MSLGGVSILLRIRTMAYYARLLWFVGATVKIFDTSKALQTSKILPQRSGDAQSEQAASGDNHKRRSGTLQEWSKNGKQRNDTQGDVGGD